MVLAQNVKTIKEYEEVLSQDRIPVYRGHILSEEDLILRRHILNLMCQFHTSWEAPQLQFAEAEEVKNAPIGDGKRRAYTPPLSGY